MDILYIYRIKENNKRAKNAIKRRFYYQLNQNLNKKTTKVFRSAFYVDEENEHTIDSFFNEYKEWIDIFKAKMKSFEYIKYQKESS